MCSTLFFFASIKTSLRQGMLHLCSIAVIMSYNRGLSGTPIERQSHVRSNVPLGHYLEIMARKSQFSRSHGGLDFTSLCPNCSSKCSNGWFKCCTYVTPGQKWNLTETKTLIFNGIPYFLEESVHISSLKSWNCKQRYHVQCTHITGVRPFWVNSHFRKCMDHRA